MAINIKFTKFDNTPWGFRLAGGSDFPQPLTVIRVTEGSLAECMGLKVGDVIVRLNDQPISNLTHGQAHEELMHAGNNFVLGVQREEEVRKAAEAISEENIVPYKIALADLPPVFPEQILKEETVIERYKEEKTVVEQTAPLSAEDEIRQEEEKLAEEKPVDANSEIVPNKNLTDDEIAQLILEEEELLSNEGLLGVNFKKLRPRATILKGSKVLEELQHIATAEPERVQELKRASTFLQKPQRPVPAPKQKQKIEEDDVETYKVVIKKQDKKTVIKRLVEKGLLPSGSEASVKTPELPASFEVKMHEMETRPKEECFPVMSDPNSPCLTISLDIDTAELDPHETRPSEDHSMHRATYKCKPKLVHVKPSHYRRSSNGRHNEIKAKPSFKDDCLESGFHDYVCSCVACDEEHLCSQPMPTRVAISRIKRTRMKGKYLATYLQRESIKLMSLMTKLFEFFLQKPDVSEPMSMPEIRRRRSSFKGYYLENVLQKNVSPVLECVKETFVNDPKITDEKEDESKSTKGSWRILANFMDYVKNSLGHLFTTSSKVKCGFKGADDSVLNERKHDECARDIEISEWHEDGPSCPLQRKSAVIVSFSDDLDKENIDENDYDDVLEYTSDLVTTGETDERSISPKHTDEMADKEDNLSKLLQSAEDYISAEIFHRRSRRLSKPRKSIDIVPEGEDNALEKLLQSAEDYVSTELFHRGSRRLSKPRKSIDIVPENDNNALGKFLQSAENYVSTEVFHRGNRRLSKSRKSIDITPEKDNDTLKQFLRAAEDYVSTEVFHRGHRRLSKSRKSIDIDPEKDESTLEKFLQSAEDYVSAEVFHRGSRRFSRSRKSIDIVPENDDDETFRKFLQSAEDYVSAEVFHRGSRRLSRSKDAGQENDVVSSLLKSTGDYVSSEVFHRRSRRLSRCFRRESVSLTPTPTWWSTLKSILNLILPWFSLKVTEENPEYSDVCEEKIGKIDSEIEHDSRRLSFVPTILYQGVTNRIGVDFTRLVAYAFVPCTSIILLYMYKPSPDDRKIPTPTVTPEPTCKTDQEGKSDSRPASKAAGEMRSDEIDEISAEKRIESEEEDYRPESRAAGSTQDEAATAEEDSSVSTTDPAAKAEKIKELVSTEINLEQQLENVQRQLLALKQLPSEIENHLRIVSDQLHKIMELSGMQGFFGNGNGGCHELSEENISKREDEEKPKDEEENTDEEDEEFTETYDYIEEIACLERKASSRSTPHMIEPSDDEEEMEEEEAEMKELDGMISVKSADEEGRRVKKFIVSYETKLLKSPSPTPSHGSFEPDLKLSPKDQVIQELQQKVHKRGRKHSQELWPQAKQLELTQGRRWRCPNDFFNDEMIAEVLSCQAEVIRGKAMGVNFKKYEKTNLPNYDHLMNSSVYKMIHKMEREPKRGIPARPAKVNAAEDVIERTKSPALSVVDNRSTRSISH
ncbi:uncharacterized protein LOC105275765 [Ooceraea biroi]|nr:uncharacterized protein LOC105275765 [Ooceraea biroi]